VQANWGDLLNSRGMSPGPGRPCQEKQAWENQFDEGLVLTTNATEKQWAHIRAD